jgi:hypothetical protein
VTDANWYGSLESTLPPKFLSPQPAGEPNPKPAVYLNAVARRGAYREGAIRRTQFADPRQAQAPAGTPGATLPSPPGTAPGTPPTNRFGAPTTPPFDLTPGTRRVRVFPRGGSQITAEIFQPNRERNEWVAVVSSGIQMIVDGVDQLGTVDIMTDRMVIWTTSASGLSVPGGTAQSHDTPLEVYMEGNIVFRQGERVVYADRMYYDVRTEVGVIFKAELLTPVEKYQGTLRMRADVVQQLSRGRYEATNAYITTSRLGVPGYRLAADEILIEDQEQVRVDPLSGQPLVDPITGEPVVDHRRRATGVSDLLLISEVPVFYWPVFSADLEKPTFYIRRANVGVDGIFGTRVHTTFDPFQILGVENPPEGTDWELNLDYMSRRGVGYGTKFAWHEPDLFGAGGPNAGLIDAWAIDDHGFDNLGGDLRRVAPEKDYRFRILERDRWELGNDWRLTGELGWISDRNFEAQYFQSEWDHFKDETTGIELKHRFDNSSLSLAADVRINSFFNEVDQLPRLDFFTLGQSLAGDWLTWYQHSSAGYFNMHTPTTPENATQAAEQHLLNWERDVGGGRYATRQEIDLPLELGPFKVVGRALGELAHWDEDLTGNDNDRAYGQLGVNVSLPMWSADPVVESELFNVHGIAHKVNFNLDVSFSDATRNLSEFPLYDPLDDNSIEYFRRQFQTTTFGGILVPSPPGNPTAIPTRFDERFYALRTGLGDWVTAPTEIADDLFAVRMGIDQRWQTKRGFPGERTLQDVVVLNSGITFFPEEERDNFGDHFGLVDYDFQWHIGERTTLLSSGLYDFFPEGQHLTQVGIHLNRPPDSSVYLGVRFLDGPFHSDVLQFSYSLRMSPKWISEFSTSYDFLNHQNIGQHLTLIRVGESFLISLGFNIDATKGTTGFMLNIEPRFLPRTRIGRVAGAQIPPAGALGLE